jgi:hypothetical protein
MAGFVGDKKSFISGVSNRGQQEIIETEKIPTFPVMGKCQNKRGSPIILPKERVSVFP